MLCWPARRMPRRLARLEFLRESQSRLGLLPGIGRQWQDSCRREFARRAAKSGSLVAALAAAGAEEQHLLFQLAAGLEVEAAEPSWKLWQDIVDRLEELRLENRSAVILLDDLDRAAPSALALAERLLALPAAPLTIAITARPEQSHRVGGRLLDQANLRIELPPWDEHETPRAIWNLPCRARAGPAGVQPYGRAAFV